MLAKLVESCNPNQAALECCLTLFICLVTFLIDEVAVLHGYEMMSVASFLDLEAQSEPRHAGRTNGVSIDADPAADAPCPSTSVPQMQANGIIGMAGHDENGR